MFLLFASTQVNDKSEKCDGKRKEYSIFFDNMTYLPCRPTQIQYPQYHTICSIAHGALAIRNTPPAPLSFVLRNATFIVCLKKILQRILFFLVQIFGPFQSRTEMYVCMYMATLAPSF